jgi:hypothetical protein
METRRRFFVTSWNSRASSTKAVKTIGFRDLGTASGRKAVEVTEKYVVLMFSRIFGCERCRAANAPYLVVENNERGANDTETSSCMKCLTEPERALLLDPARGVSEARMEEIWKAKHEGFLKSRTAEGMPIVAERYYLVNDDTLLPLYQFAEPADEPRGVAISGLTVLTGERLLARRQARAEYEALGNSQKVGKVQIDGEDFTSDEVERLLTLDLIEPCTTPDCPHDFHPLEHVALSQLREVLAA